MNNTYLDGFISGLIVAILISVAAYHIAPNNIVRQSAEAIKQCESTLPRDQHCTIVAVPE